MACCVLRASGTAALAVLFLGCAPHKPAEKPSSDAGSKPAAAAAPWRPRPLTNRTFERTPARMARGEYLVESVAHCFICHSQLDFKKPGLPPRPGMKGSGDELTPEESLLPPPYRVVHPNISPDPETGAGRWTDDMLARAIREGIGHDGRVLAPYMPYQNLRLLSDEDLASVIVYIRSIPPVRYALPKSHLPQELMASLHPEPINAPVPEPDLSTPVKRGEWLVRIANCSACHTPIDQNFNDLPGMYLAGGGQLKGRHGEVYSANLTPDPSSPFYTATAEQFIEIIRTGKVTARVLNSIMLWGYYRGMTDEDLRAIYAYLRTVQPVKHRVDNTEPPSYCKLCGQAHGLGAMN
jgi:mono/diheme cytochrome c family protein